MTKTDPALPRVRQRLPVPYTVPVVVERPTACNCQTGNGLGGFEQKIKENPLVFVLGAALIGYLLAKN